MNPGGIRSDLPFKNGGDVNYTDIFTVQPFGNDLVVMTLTGSEIETILKQQYLPTGNNILQVSEGFSFTWRQPEGQPIEIVPGSMKLNGQPLVPGQPYRIVTNNFLAGGGDSFFGFKIGTHRVTLGKDLQALEDYVEAHTPIAGGIRNRIRRAN
jgi:5'-nucleotidase